MSVLSGLSGTPTMDETVAEINGLAALDQGWDGEGAEAVSPVAISRAILVLTNAVEAAHARGATWDAPDVAPTADGGVGLSWRRVGRSLLVIVHPNHATVVCVKKDENGASSRHVVNLDQVSEYIIWMLNP